MLDKKTYCIRCLKEIKKDSLFCGKNCENRIYDRMELMGLNEKIEYQKRVLTSFEMIAGLNLEYQTITEMQNKMLVDISKHYLWTIS